MAWKERSCPDGAIQPWDTQDTQNVPRKQQQTYAQTSQSFFMHVIIWRVQAKTEAVKARIANEPDVEPNWAPPATMCVW